MGLSHDELLNSLSYDPETGVFRWLTRPSMNVKIGDVAGTVKNTDGYRQIRIGRTGYLAHRLAWFYVNGRWPDSEIDHRNRVRDDNRLSNLRQATRKQNAVNQTARPNASGLVGVRRMGKSWRADTRINGRKIYLGSFETAQSAHAAYLSRIRSEHGEFAP